MASLSCGTKLNLADVEVLTRECHRQMASLVDERASGSSHANAGAQAGGSGCYGNGAGGASSTPPRSLGDDGDSDNAGERAPDGEGPATLPNLALVDNMAVADALPRFVNALLHQKEQEPQQQEQQQQSGLPKFTFGKARPAPSSPPGRKTVATSTDHDETGGAAAIAATAAAAATVSPARCGESYTSARRGGGDGGGVKATLDSDGGGNFRESSGPGPQGPCPACEEEDAAAVQRGALEGCQKCRPVWITPEEYDRDSLVEMERADARTLPTFTAIVTEEEFRRQQQQKQQQQQQWCYCDYHHKMLDQILRNVELENEGEGEGGTVMGSGDEEGQEKNKGQQYEAEERPAALRDMETQVRKSLSVLWMSEGWDGVTGRRESATAGPLAEASRATTLGETNASMAADRDPTPPTDAVIRANPNLFVTTLTPSAVSPCEPASIATATTPTTEELRNLAHAQEWSSKRFSEWSPIRRSPERSKKRWSPKRRASPPLLLLPESSSAASIGGRPPAGSKSPSSATIAAFRSTSTEDGARAVAFSAFLWSHGYGGESGTGSAVVTEASFPGGALRQFEHTLDFLNSTPAMGLGRETPSGGTPTPSSICWRYAKTIALQRHRHEQQRRRRAQRHQQQQQQGRQLEEEAKTRQRQTMKEAKLSRQLWRQQQQQEQHAKQQQQQQQQQQRTEAISKQVGPTVRHKSTDQVETERRERAPPQTQPKGETLSPTKEDDRGFLPPPPLFNFTQRLQKERPLPQQPEQDGGKHDLVMPPPTRPSLPVSSSPPLHGAASQHQQQRTARSASTGNASAPAPPAAGNTPTAPVAQQQKARRERGSFSLGASWHSYRDMSARKKMFVQIIKFFREQKPSTLPEWVQKVKKRPSFPIAVEAVLYQQASSLGDYEDSTAVGPRMTRIIRSMNKEARASATTKENNWREHFLE
ncbi:unnamed protein product [Ectocarpus sp. 13 AM-2016]